MKSLKKMKKRLSKKLEKAKEYLSAQKFYLKQGLQSLGHLLHSATRVSLLLILVLFSGLAANKMHVKYLENKVGSNTVFIRSMPDSKLQGSGTAFEMKTPSGKVITVTNAHICELANSKGEIAILEKRHSNRLIPKKVIEVYEENDLCVVEGLDGYEGLELGSDLEVGEPVFSFGYPLGQALHFSDGRVKEFGKVTLLDEETPVDKCVGPRHKVQKMQIWFFIVDVCTKSFDSVQTSMVIYGGNSGSPMVNMWGNVVGVVFAGNSRTNWGSAVPLKDLKQLLKAY